MLPAWNTFNALNRCSVMISEYYVLGAVVVAVVGYGIHYLFTIDADENDWLGPLE